VDLEPGRSLVDLIRLRRTLEALLDTSVDVVSSRGLRERVRHKVMAEAVSL
jgi:predicted nucleotidyltransferase